MKCITGLPHLKLNLNRFHGVFAIHINARVTCGRKLNIIAHRDGPAPR